MRFQREITLQQEDSLVRCSLSLLSPVRRLRTSTYRIFGIPLTPRILQGVQNSPRVPQRSLTSERRRGAVRAAFSERHRVGGDQWPHHRGDSPPPCRWFLFHVFCFFSPRWGLICLAASYSCRMGMRLTLQHGVARRWRSLRSGSSCFTGLFGPPRRTPPRR